MTAPKKVRGIGWRHHDDTDDDLDELHAEVERAASAERERIVALLTERAEATRDWDGRETVVSLTYCQAADLARGGPRDP